VTNAQITLHDSLTNRPRALEPRDPGKVGIYVCGPTVYSRIHVGNARPYVMFALFKRFLQHQGYDVTLVENVTDINDKIYVAARSEGRSSDELAREMTAHYRADTDRLGLGRPDHEPLASETVGQIIDLIESLIDRGHAYPSNGDVYFSVRSFPGYGKLSNRRLEDLAPGEQGEPDEDTALKRDPLDFALWKAHKPDEDTSWDSPWGRGRPGWHIECSAMAEAFLGLDFDLHGGGSDLLFPHHENEIAQTEGGRGKPLARLWMHNGMVRFEEEKMAKSVGNVTRLADALERHGRDALIMYFLRGHYRQPLQYSDELVEDAGRAIERIANFARLVRRASAAPGPGAIVAEHRAAFFEALRDDFNTPRALAALFELINAVNRDGFTADVEPALAEMLEVLGLEHLLQADQPVDEALLQLAAERDEARQTRDFERADRVRDELREHGYEVRDTPEGPELVPIRDSE
jgi:cysteinyl-tRNA synthetase